MSHDKKGSAKQSALASRLKAARKKLGLSQSEAAREWSVSVRTLQEWEHGRSEPRGFAGVHLEKLLAGILAANAKPTSRPKRRG